MLDASQRPFLLWTVYEFDGFSAEGEGLRRQTFKSPSSLSVVETWIDEGSEPPRLAAVVQEHPGQTVYDNHELVSCYLVLPYACQNLI